MKRIFATTFTMLAIMIGLAFTMATPASAELVRGTVLSDGPYKGQMIVRNVQTGAVATRGELEAAGVDIWKPIEVYAYFGVRYDYASVYSGSGLVGRDCPNNGQNDCGDAKRW